MINLFTDKFIPLFHWILWTSIATGIMLILIFILKALLNRHLKPKWHYIMWVLVFIKCIMPWSPESTYSIYNIIHTGQSPATSAMHQKVESGSLHFPLSVQGINTGGTLNSGINASKNSPASLFNGVLQFTINHIWTVLCLIWLLGILVMLLYLGLTAIRFQKKIHHGLKAINPDLSKIFLICKEKIGIKHNIPVNFSRNISSPTLLGYFKPQLLLPYSLDDKLSQEEWEHVFSHELSHVKRHDIGVNWIASFILVLHWFNPLMWAAYRRMRMDQEVACDAQVLSYMDAEKRMNYGHTIIRLLESCSKSVPTPGIAQLSGNKRHLKGRLKMIKTFRKQPVLWSIIALVFIVGIALATMTGAKTLMTAKDSHKSGLPKHTQAKNTPASAKQNTQTPHESLLHQINSQAQVGKVPFFIGDVPYFQFAVDNSSINDVQSIWGKEDKVSKAGLGVYMTYNKQKAAFGINKKKMIFDARSYGTPLHTIHQSEVQTVLGIPNDARAYQKQSIWDYQVSPKLHLLFIFRPKTDKHPDPVIDHLSVVNPSDAGQSAQDSNNTSMNDPVPQQPQLSSGASGKTDASNSKNHSNYEAVIHKLVSFAKKGKLPFFEFTLSTTSIKDIEKKWGKPDHTDVAGKGVYATYNAKGAAFGINRKKKIFDIRIYTGIIKKIHLQNIINVLGKSDDIRYYGQQIIWVYHINRNDELEFILPKPTGQQPDPLVDHISVYSKADANK